MSGDGKIVQYLHEIQHRCGYLPKNELRALSDRRPEYPLHRIHEVASFFPHFLLEAPKGLDVRVCRDMACHLFGAQTLRRELEEYAAGPARGQIVVEGISCLGQCDGAPAVMIGEHVYKGKGTSAEAYGKLINDALAERSAVNGKEGPRHHKHEPPGPPGPTGWKIDPYDGVEEYGAVRKFVANPDTKAFFKNLEVSDLRGMGGAGVPAHQKWKDVAQARGQTKYVVVNGDESEPSTFKDRELLLRTPKLVIEGVILGGLVTGAERGYIYIRHEYPEQVEAVRAAIARAEKIGACGKDVFGTGRSFPVEVFVSPGGYICGEQSALIEAMEGHRAEPRNKPPQLETNGLHDKPTLLSNVETFAWVPAIVVNGGEWYRDGGVNGYKGMRFLSICGDLEEPGVFEVPIGITLRELIDRAGGMRGGKPLKAWAPSGPSGGFLPARIARDLFPRGFEKRVPERFLAERFKPDASHFDILDFEIDLDLSRAVGIMIGAGMVVYAEGTDIFDQALNSSQFFRNESCGKCVPCRLGSQKMVDLALGLANQAYDRESLPRVEGLINELRRTMELTSICGLGAVAANPVSSVIRYFPEEVRRRALAADSRAATSVESPR
jgi:NADH:ubiquinone oxidoreductase subunit F (NADH-binding)/NADH:ubiquinone oxidoreductase subunit E